MLTALVVGVIAPPAEAVVFSNPAFISIPDQGLFSPYPSTIEVSGLTGTIVDVNVTLNDLTHTYPDDVDVLLTAPTGQQYVVLMADAGGDFVLDDVDLTFDAAAALPLPNNPAITSGTYRPANYGSYFIDPALTNTSLSIFNGLTPNGTWYLNGGDDSENNASGSISGGWSIDITTTPSPIVVNSFAPTEGLVGDAVVITGTGFTGATAVRFGGISTSTFTVNSPTQITATVPAGALTGPISVDGPTGTGSSASDFVVLGGDIVVSSFAPTQGFVGDTVVVTGTTLTGATSVRFAGTAASTFTVDSPTQITATVPAGAGTGPISVVGPSGAGSSASDFVVHHGRDVSLTLSKHKAKGTVGVDDGFADCRTGVPVKVQRRQDGRWKTVAAVLSNDQGDYSAPGSFQKGRYRSLAKETTLSSGDVCLKVTSPKTKA